MTNNPKEEKCYSCGGKGTYSQIHGQKASDDFGGEGYTVAPTIHNHPCKACNGTGLTPHLTETEECQWENCSGGRYCEKHSLESLPQDTGFNAGDSIDKIAREGWIPQDTGWEEDFDNFYEQTKSIGYAENEYPDKQTISREEGIKIGFRNFISNLISQTKEDTVRDILREKQQDYKTLRIKEILRNGKDAYYQVEEIEKLLDLSGY